MSISRLGLVGSLVSVILGVARFGELDHAREDRSGEGEGERNGL